MTPDPVDPDDDPPEALAADLIIPALGSGLALYYLVSTIDLAWEARATGSTIAGVLLSLCGLFIVRSLLRARRGSGRFTFGDLFENSGFNRQRLALIGLLIVFIATIPWLGTTLGMFCLLLASLRVMGVTSPRQLLGISLSASVAVYVLFIFLLNSRMPRGLIENALATILPPLGGS